MGVAAMKLDIAQDPVAMALLGAIGILMVTRNTCRT
jgi:hypothetical protein